MLKHVDLVMKYRNLMVDFSLIQTLEIDFNQSYLVCWSSITISKYILAASYTLSSDENDKG